MEKTNEKFNNLFNAMLKRISEMNDNGESYERINEEMYFRIEEMVKLGLRGSRIINMVDFDTFIEDGTAVLSNERFMSHLSFAKQIHDMLGNFENTENERMAIRRMIKSKLTELMEEI